MSAAMVMRLPLSVDLSGFVELLERLQVPHRVSEEGNEQVLWTLDHLVEDVRQLYQRYPEGNPDIELAPLPGPSKPPRPSLAAQVKASKARDTSKPNPPARGFSNAELIASGKLSTPSTMDSSSRQRR